MDYKVSIIIPVYNVEKYLSQCLDSVVNQTYSNIELILINDGSTDKSLFILEEYSAKDSRIKIINQKNRGLSEARNRGLDVASGDFIMFLDSDDWIEIDTCEKLITIAIKNDADLIFHDYIREYSGVSRLKKVWWNSSQIERIDKIRFHRRLFGLTKDELAYPDHADSIVTACIKLYRSSCIKDVRFIDTKLIGTEDLLFNVMALSEINNVIYVPIAFYHYRRDNSNSLTTIYKENLFNQWKCLFQLLRDQIRHQKLDESFELALNNRISLSLIGLGLNVMSSNKSMKDKYYDLKVIINSSIYKFSIVNLDLKYFKIHWYCLFYCAKYSYTSGVFCLLKVLSIIHNYNK